MDPADLLIDREISAEGLDPDAARRAAGPELTDEMLPPAVLKCNWEGTPETSAERVELEVP
jgi:hypothetical protein